MSARKIVLVVIAVLWMTAAVAVVALAQEEVTLTFTTWDVGSGLEIIQGIINQFTEETGINVEIQSQTGAEDPSILVRMAAGTAPDVLQTGDFVFRRQALAPEGGFLDLTPMVEADQEFDRSAYYPEIFDIGVLDGGIYALPQTFATVAYYINVDLFEAAGIPLPEEGWTYDDLLELAKELTLDANGNNANSPAFDPENIVQYGWFHHAAWVRPFWPVAYSYGAQVLSEDGLTATDYLNQQAMVDALDLYRKSVFEWHISPSIAAQEAQPGVDLFASGQVAIYGAHGPWQIREYSENPDLNFAVVPMPTGPEGRFSVTCWAGHGVNKNTTHPEEAYDLVKFMATVGQNAYVDWGLVPHIEAATAAGQVDDPYQGVFMNEISKIQPLDDFKNEHFVECVANPVGQLIQSLMSEGAMDIDIQAQLDKIAADADTCLTQ